MKKAYSFICALFLCLSVGAQTRVYKNYGVQDGLPGSTVYFVLQDSKGYMWFGTDMGLSRYDGTNFKNYSTKDGLPDNDVFRLSEDSMGRIWMTCYNSKPCYLYKGIIHNSDNDSLLQQIEEQTQLFREICVDKQGRAWILGLKIYLVEQTTIRKFDTPENKVVIGLGYINNKLSIVTTDGTYLVNIHGNKINYKQVNSFKHVINSTPVFFAGGCYVIQVEAKSKSFITLIRNNTIKTINLSQLGIQHVIWSHAVFNPIDSSLLVSTVPQGIRAFSTELQLKPEPFPFLPADVTYTYTTIDRDGNTWICSLGKGVFFVAANRILLYTTGNAKSEPVVSSVYKTRSGVVFAGFDNCSYAVLNQDKLITYDIKDNSFTGKKITRIFPIDTGNILMAGDYGIFTVPVKSPSLYKRINSNCIKNITYDKAGSLLAGLTTDAVRLVKADTGYTYHSLWNSRTTAIAKDTRGVIWLGSLNGLFVKDTGTPMRYDKNILINKSRITDLAVDEYNNIWVATHQHGIFIITGDTTLTINSSSGLTDDACLRFFKEKNGHMWVATRNGISNIRYWFAESLHIEISSPGDIWGGKRLSVNDLYIDSADIWLATSDGLLQMERNWVKPAPAPNVLISSFMVSDSQLIGLASPVLKHFQNTIQIDYIGISYNSSGRINYKYYLSSSADTVFTSNTTLNLSSLSPGKYLFTVWAKNLSGVWSTLPATLTFQILPPVWQTWWFVTMVIAILLGLLWIVVAFRIRKIRMREREKTAINKKIATVELKAIRSQMNEHFIFNSLNSIQNFINQNNIESANYYLSSFGSLIRKTMDISLRPYITLKEEIDYLENYLMLEKMRFDEHFDWKITNNCTGISNDYALIPPMIIQPYVENAIRHGLMHKTSSKGYLLITFDNTDGNIICRIEDNGIGRKKAAIIKANSVVKHQSKGMHLSDDKLELYNKLHYQKMWVDISDIDSKLDETGTVVLIYIPLEINI